MKKNKLWWSLLIALMLPLSFALTSCGDDDDDDDKNSGGSNKLSYTAWFGTDSEGTNYEIIFLDDKFYADAESPTTYLGCYGSFSVSGDNIRLRNVKTESDSDGRLFRNGTYEFELTGRKGSRELAIGDILPDGEDLLLEEVPFDDDGSDDDWDDEW
ncbi:MAG: hypothetical protein NC210_04845 [[Clostridium] fimetarium]|nr:hypothetical protein [Alistipes timonensis]MCM1405733.1 hypothetical protein [[Clostridium] fimetarium]